MIVLFLLIGIAPMMVQSGIMIRAYQQSQLESRMQEIQNPVSYTHLDVYKRQHYGCGLCAAGSDRR